MARRRRSPEVYEDKRRAVGGLPFFITLSCALFLGLFNLLMLPRLWSADSAPHLFRFAAGAIVGALAAKVLAVGHLSVMLHELKHYIVSQCAGNKSKGFQVKSGSGFFKYAYTRETEKFNALIALAPYWFPLSTIFAGLLAIPVYYSKPALVTVIVGLGVGADAFLNTRDISPIQTDLSDISGGYKIAVLFIIAMNLALLTLVLAWVASGVFGFKVLTAGLWEFMTPVVQYYLERMKSVQ